MLSDLWNRLVAWTGTLVAPDWASLVALIPVLLLPVVVAFLAVTGAKWAGAGPTRRGPGRRPPRSPDGRAVRVVAAAPLAVACGAFTFAFGLVAGGPWPAVGVAVAVVGLGWWAAALRRGGLAGRGRTDAPAKSQDAARDEAVSPPGAGIATGRIVLALTGLVAAAVLVATTRVVPDPPSGGGASTAASASSPLPAAPTTAVSAPAVGSLPSADVTLAARGIRFVAEVLIAPAGRPFTVAFDNRDNVPHNLEIRDATGKVLFRGDLVTGPTVTLYDVPALPAGQYPFICTVHPAMSGTLTVR